jgi:hypothetical protein
MGEVISCIAMMEENELSGVDGPKEKHSGMASMPLEKSPKHFRSIAIRCTKIYIRINLLHCTAEKKKNVLFQFKVLEAKHSIVNASYYIQTTFCF